MQSIDIFLAPLNLRPRQALAGHAAKRIWRVQSGVLRIDQQAADGSLHFIRLALPGDVLGVEALAGASACDVRRAITPVTLSPVRLGDEQHLAQLFRDAVVRNYQRCRETASLRIGTVDERVRRLLLLIAHGHDDMLGQLAIQARLRTIPSLVNIASIINAAPETVSRIISGFRQSGFLLEEKRPRRTNAVNPSLPTSATTAYRPEPGLARQHRPDC